MSLPRNIRVVALDPGGTTGWAIYEALREGRKWSNGLWRWGQIGPQPHHLELEQFLEKETLDPNVADTRIVCESFQFRQGRQRSNINLISRNYIGITELFVQKHPEVKLVQFTAGQAKKFVTDEKLRVMGRWVKGQKHARDANRHLIFYLVNRLGRHDLTNSWKELL